jgi:uncharacterized protein
MPNQIPQSLSFLIKPASYLCNIQCTYCFYARVHEVYGETKPFMSDHTLEQLIRGALEVGAPHNSFCWQGGEPTLLGIDFFERVREYQQRFRRPFQTVENSLQTNGILLDSKWCRFLKKEDFLVGISLDGPAHIHDHYRRDRKGKGTFDRVFRSIQMMEEAHVPFNILCLLTDANIDQPETVYRFFRKQGFPFLQFITCREIDSTTGMMEKYAVRADSVGRFYCKVFDLWMKDGFPDVSIRMFEDILLYQFEKIHASCCWMDRCQGYLVVEHNGDCYPCDFFVYPQWELGNLCARPVLDIWNSAKRMQFSQRKADLPEDCKHCEYLGFCNGDCTRFRASTGSGFGKSDYCEATRMLLAHMAPSMPRIEKKVQAVRAAQNPGKPPGRNDPCPCGSGRKFKKCCG